MKPQPLLLDQYYTYIIQYVTITLQIEVKKEVLPLETQNENGNLFIYLFFQSRFLSCIIHISIVWKTSITLPYVMQIKFDYNTDVYFLQFACDCSDSILHVQLLCVLIFFYSGSIVHIEGYHPHFRTNLNKLGISGKGK